MHHRPHTSPPTTPASPDPPRPRLPRVRTGCLSCKRAHVKCSAGKPACERCLRTGRACDYPAPPGPKPKHKDVAASRALATAPRPLRQLLPASGGPVPVTTGLSALLNRPSHFSDLDDPNAALYFDRFRSQAARYRSATTDPDDFWFRTLLRETANDNGILAAVLGLGALAQSLGPGSEDVSLFSVNSVKSPDPQQTSYRDAIKYYTLSIAKLRKRLADPASLHEAPSPRDTAPAQQDATRSVLISSILYSAFELMHGNASAADRIVAKGMSMLRRMILHQKQPALPAVEKLSLDDDSQSASSSPDPSYSQISQSCDDAGMEEAEWLLVRRAVLGSLYAPMRPLSRDVICSLPDLNFLAGSKPPPLDASPPTYWKLYFRWLPLAALWYVRASTFRMPTSAGPDSACGKTEGAEVEMLDLQTEPWRVLLEEREALLGQMRAWEAAIHARLVLAATVEESAVLRQILPNCKNLRYQIMSLFGSIAAPEKREEMRALSCEIIEMSEQVFEVLPGIKEGRDEMRESLSAVGVLMSQNCRESADTRKRALALCRQLIDSRSRWDAKGVVMGTSKLMEIEEEGREMEEDYIPVSAQWDWTLASWDEGFTELTVVYTPKTLQVEGTGATASTGANHAVSRKMILRPTEYGY